ncbi:carboxymethylenebutenolidase [Microtetraspora sp. NBRC 13810]|nr:carboxymethylenebutenolidase [Microtetraspora sp. NBRC 13810]
MVSTGDGDFDVPLWLPPAGRGPGILLVQEIFGVGPYIRKVAEDLAALGYVVAAPELFWRLRAHWRAEEGDDPVPASIDLASRFDFETGVADCELALRHLRGLPEVTGRTGALGFCLGGSLAYTLAARTDLDALVSFYGSQVPGTLDLMDRITAPALFVFGGSDPYIPREDVAKVERAAAGRPGMEVHVLEEAGHAFHNHVAPGFYDAKAAPVAWELAVTFLERHLPVT